MNDKYSSRAIKSAVVAAGLILFTYPVYKLGTRLRLEIYNFGLADHFR